MILLNTYDVRSPRVWLVGFVFCLMTLTTLYAAEPTPQAYRMHAGDTLTIQVDGHEELSLEVTIGPNGRITYPSLGVLAVDGLTTAELAKWLVNITTPNGNPLKDTKVTVSVKPLHPADEVALDTSTLAAVSSPPSSTPITSPARLTEAQHKQLADKLITALAQAKLENLTVATDSQEGWTIGFENRTYRSDIDALATSLRIIAGILPPVHLSLQAKRDNIPICRVSLNLSDYTAVQEHKLTPEELVQRWQVAPDALGESQSLQQLATGNSSRGKIDIALRPAIHYEIGNETKPFMSDEFIVARVDATLAQGWHANLQSSTRLTSGTSSVLDRALLTKTDWIGRNLLATASVGKFENALYGWYGEAQWEKHQHRLGVVGSITGNDLGVGSRSYRQAIGYYEYDWGKIGLTTRLGCGRFIDNSSNAALLSLRRRFGESVIIAEAIRAQGGEEALNLRVSVPLGPRIAHTPSQFRLRSDTAFKIDYMSNLGLTGNYLQTGQDLASFRGELTAPYVQQHPYRVLDERKPRKYSQWPVSPSSEGNSGLIRIPTADVIPDGTLLAGISYMDRDHSRVMLKTDAMPLFVGIGLLPNLEIVGKVTVLHDRKAFSWGV